MCLIADKLCIFCILYYFAVFLHPHDDTLIDGQGVSAVDVFSAVILSFGASCFFFATLTSHRFLTQGGFKPGRVSPKLFGLLLCSDICDNALRWVSRVAYKFRDNMLIRKNLHQTVNSS